MNRYRITLRNSLCFVLESEKDLHDVAKGLAITKDTLYSAPFWVWDSNVCVRVDDIVAIELLPANTEEEPF